jgi:hypothetical protein
MESLHLHLFPTTYRSGPFLFYYSKQDDSPSIRSILVGSTSLTDLLSTLARKNPIEGREFDLAEAGVTFFGGEYPQTESKSDWKTVLSEAFENGRACNLPLSSAIVSIFAWNSEGGDAEPITIDLASLSRTASAVRQIEQVMVERVPLMHSLASLSTLSRMNLRHLLVALSLVGVALTFMASVASCIILCQPPAWL